MFVFGLLLLIWRSGALGIGATVCVAVLWFLKRLGAFESIPSIDVPFPEGQTPKLVPYGINKRLFFRYS